MITAVYGAYPVPSVSESTHIENVMAVTPYRKWEKRKDGNQEKEKNKKKKQNMEGSSGELKESVPGQIGCFFEAKA